MLSTTLDAGILWGYFGAEHTLMPQQQYFIAEHAIDRPTELGTVAATVWRPLSPPGPCPVLFAAPSKQLRPCIGGQMGTQGREAQAAGVASQEWL
jgi:hypothetical protein